MRQTRTTTLFFAALFALGLTSGCNRALPTEPEDSPLAVASLDETTPSEGSESATVTRRRPARPAPGGTSKPPTTTPTTDPDPDPTPTTPPPSTPPPTTPPPTATTDCIGPCDGILRVPDNGEVMAAIYAARDRVRTAVQRGEIKAKNKVRNWDVVPAIEWKACFFFVENGFYYDAQGNRVVGACAAGMTDWSRRTIVISTKEPSRTVPLVKWEATNYYLYLIGRTDLLDRFQ